MSTPAPDLFKKSGDFAYGDVDRAFTYFLEHYSKGRPFIIASHSQGTEHGMNLVKRRIDGTPLAARMVAAYLIGGGITDKEVDALKTVHACASPTDLHCVIHWATYREGPNPVRDDTPDKLLCVNPLTWLRDGGHGAGGAAQGRGADQRQLPDQVLGQRQGARYAVRAARCAVEGLDAARNAATAFSS